VRLGAPSGPVEPGSPSDLAVQAKKLYEAERFASAAPMLLRVANGEAGDDIGNRQLAELALAKALYRLGRIPECLALFGGIARRRNHLKLDETALWLMKLYDDGADVGPDDFAALCDEQQAIDEMANGEQATLRRKSEYLCGRVRFGAARYEEAIELFEHVLPEDAEYDAARDCIARARARIAEHPRSDGG
jgi:hypothetical protein